MIDIASFKCINCKKCLTFEHTWHLIGRLEGNMGMTSSGVQALTPLDECPVLLLLPLNQ